MTTTTRTAVCWTCDNTDLPQSRCHNCHGEGQVTTSSGEKLHCHVCGNRGHNHSHQHTCRDCSIVFDCNVYGCAAFGSAQCGDCQLDDMTP